MAVTTTTRFGLTRWSAGSDPFSRAQMDASHAAVEALGAIYGQGTLAARPAAGTQGRYYTVRGDGATANNGRVFYDDGTTWYEVGTAVRDVTVRANAAASVPLTVVGTTGQTGKLQEWRSTAGLVGSIAPDGSIVFGAATLGTTSVTTLTASGTATLNGNLVVAGVASFGNNATVNGTLKASTFKSTAVRASGAAKTELNDDGTGRFDALIPPGFFMASLRSDVPAGWLRMQGQTVNVATYPDLFDALGQPGGSGATTFQIPDWRDRTTVGASATKALGSVGGSAQVTLTVNELPGHVHTIAHDHTVAHSHTIAHTHDFAHTHSIAHDHPAFTSGSENADHAHYYDTGYSGGHSHTELAPAIGSGAVGGSSIYRERALATTGGDGGHSHAGWTGGINANHQHSIDVPAFSGTSGGASTTTTGASSAASSGTSTPTTSAPSAANSGSTGSGAAFSTQDPYGAGHWMIKT